MSKFKKYWLIGLVVAFAFVLTACSSNDAEGNSGEVEGEFTLDSDVEFVVPYSAGGGSDTNARTIAKIMKDEDIIEKSILVVNKPGGSGAVGGAYTYSKKGDSSTISTFVSGQISSALMSDAEVQLEDYTPLGTLALDSFLLLVDNDSPYKTFEDFVKAAKENPGEISVGGAGKGGEDHMVYYLTNREAGIDTKFVTFQGGGETLSALMGGHIDAVYSNPSEVLSQIEGGELRALASTNKTPLTAPLEEVPTFKDLGYPEIFFQQFRGIVGPPDMSAEAVSFWEDALKGVNESEEWQTNYIEKFSLQPTYMNAEEAKQYFEESEEQYNEILTELGLMK